MEDQSITLRKATPADVAAIIAVEQKVGSKTYSPITEEEATLEEMRKGPLYLIQKEGEVIGNISYEMKDDRSVYLSGFAIDPKYQGQGYGREALQQILSEVKNAPKVELVVHPDNVKAVKLYESLGFTITGRKDNYFGDGEPRVVLTLIQKP